MKSSPSFCTVCGKVPPLPIASAVTAATEIEQIGWDLASGALTLVGLELLVVKIGVPSLPI